MRAALLTQHGGPDSIELADIDEPEPAAGQTLIEVRATAFSYADLLMSRGLYQFQPPLPHPLGVDVVGISRDDLPEHGIAAGDRVATVLTHGGSAEVAAAQASDVLAVPAHLSDAEAATLPLAFHTAHVTLVARAQARPGEWVLVNGATGTVGSALVQTASALGCRVIAYARSASHNDLLRTLGAEVVVNEWAHTTVREATEGRGVDIVTDVIGTDDIVLEGLRSLTTGGRFMVLGFVGGSIPHVKMNRLLLNNIDVRGVSWGPYARGSRVRLQRQWGDILSWVEARQIVPPRTQVRPLDDTAAALRALVTGGPVRQVIAMTKPGA